MDYIEITRKFAEDNELSPTVAKRIIDALAKRGLDIDHFNRVLYKLECLICQSAVKERLNKSSEEDINIAIDEIINDSMEWYLSEIVLSEEGFSEDKEYELITTAKQTDHRYWDFEYSKDDLETMAKNFNDNIVGTEIPVDLNHDPEHIAYAWIKPGSMKVKKSSQLDGHYSLYAQLYKFTPEGRDMITTGKVRYFSLQIQTQFAKFVDKVKKVYKLVIRAMALTNMPVIKDMAPTLSEEKTASLFPNHSQMADTTELERKLAEKDTILAQKDVKLSETEAENKRLSEENASIKKEQRDKNLAENVEALTLSEDRKIGFKGGEKASVLEFVKTLSDDQAKQYFEVHKNILTSVVLGEEGGSGEGDPAPTDSDGADEKVADLAEKMAKKENITVREATDRVLAENPKLAEAISK